MSFLFNNKTSTLLKSWTVIFFLVRLLKQTLFKVSQACQELCLFSSLGNVGVPGVSTLTLSKENGQQGEVSARAQP